MRRKTTRLSHAAERPRATHHPTKRNGTESNPCCPPMTIVTRVAHNQIDPAITLSAMLAPGDDKTRWSSTSGAEVTGFVLDVKPGGGETCNCGKTDAAHIDARIELVLNSTDTAGTQSVVVEVTPRLRAIMGASGTDWSTKTLRKQFRRKWVKVRRLDDVRSTGTAFPAFHANHHALTVDVTNLQSGHFRAPHARAIECHEQGALLEIARRIQELRDLLHAQHCR